MSSWQSEQACKFELSRRKVSIDIAAYSDFRLVPKVMHGDGMADMTALLAL